MSNEFDDAVAAAMQPAPGQAARLGFSVAADTNPDAYAEAQRVARRTGVPVGTVFSMPQEMKRQAAVGSIDFDTLAQTSPATAALLADVEKAKIAHDDVENMSGIESALSFLGGSAKAGFNDLAGAGAKLLDALNPFTLSDSDAAVLYRNDPQKLERMREQSSAMALSRFARGRTKASEQNMRDISDGAKATYGDLKYATLDTGEAAYLSPIKVIGDAIRSLPTTAALALTTYLARGAAVQAEKQALASGMTAEAARGAAVSAATGIAVKFGAASEGSIGYAQQALQTQNEVESMQLAKLEASPEYQQLVGQGYEPDAARIFLAARAGEQAGVGAGVIDALTNAVGGRVLGRIIGEGGGLLPRMARGAANEAGVEFVQSGGEQVAQNIAIQANADPSQGLMDGVLESMLQGLFVGGLTGGAFAGAAGRAQKAQAAQQQTEQIEQINQLAAASKVLKRDPETFEAFVAQAAEGGPVQQVFISADALMQSGMAEQVAAVSPAVADQLETAAATGGQVAIPVEEYAARIAPTEAAPALLDHLKTDPEGFSRAEAQQYMQSHSEELRADVERALADQQADDAFKQSAEMVRAAVKAQLDTTARFTPEVNAAYSSMVGDFYAVQAAKLGITPEAMFQRYPLKVSAERIDGSTVYAQSQDGAVALRALADEGSQSAVLAQALVDRLGLGPENLPDIFEGVALGTESDRLGGIPSLAPVLAQMRAAVLDSPKVLDAVVGAVPVDVVDNLFGSKSAAKVALHDEAVLQNSPSFDAELPVSSGSGNASGSVGLLVREAAFAATKVLRVTLGAGRESHKGGAAVGADQGGTFSQGASPRATFDPSTLTITLLRGSDLSSFLHESGHFFLEVQADLSSQPDAPQNVVQDMQTVLNWFGVLDMAAWQAMDLEQKRPYHEQFARGFEAYLFDGKAPGIEMQSVFQRFRAWLLNVYRDLKALNVELTDEVRSVFDRMLATGEQIALAEQGRSMLPLFATAQQAGMTAEEFAAYQALGTDATNDAIQDLQARGLRDMQWLHNARGREIKRLQKEAEAKRAEVRQQVAEEVNAEPVYRADRFLRYGELELEPGATRNVRRTAEQANLEGAKLSLPALKEMYGDGVNAIWRYLPTGKKGLAATEGMHPDLIAEMFGFSSGDQLVRQLLAAPKRSDEIEARTDIRMLEQFGELSTPDAIAKAADRAIHNDARARFVATETNALARATGQRKVLLDAAREFAKATIARLRVRDLRPGQYANAEAKAAQNAASAMKSGDLATAAAEKRNQLIQQQLTRATYGAQEEVDKAVRYLKKFDSPGVRKNLDMDYLDQIDAMLERFDLRQRSDTERARAASLRTWVQSRLNEGEIPDFAEALLSPAERARYQAAVQSRDAEGNLIYADDEEAIKLLADAIDNSAQRHYRDLTVEELLGLQDTVSGIEHLGRLKNKLLTARDNETYEAVRDQIALGIGAHSEGGKNTRTANDWLGSKLQDLRQFGFAHIKVATWARIMDGGKDNGPVWSYLIRPANERATQETTMRSEATAKLDAILRPILAKVPALDKIGSGKLYPSLGISLNWQERFAILLNLGNESNTQRLLDGNGWSMAQLQPVLQSFSAEELQAAQAIWDTFEGYRPLIGAKELRVSGKEPKWITPRKITILARDGKAVTLRGGYYPVVYDSRTNLGASQHAKAEEAKNAMKAAYSANTTRRSFTKSRVEEVKGRPLLLNLQGLYSGINDVIHDLAWHEWVIDANKLLRSTTIDGAMRDGYGPEVKREFEAWRDDIVAGSRRLDHAIERAAGWARQGVSASALTFNVLSAAMQPLGLTNSMARVGAAWVAKGLGRYVAGPVRATREAQAKSEWLTNRTRTRFRELNELRNQVQGQTAGKELMGRYGYWLMMRTQLMVDVPTWWGAYEKAIADGRDEDTAVALADQAVKDSQGGGEEVDQSGVERGGPLVKLFTAFYGFMGTTLNTVYLDAKTSSSKAKLAANMLLVLAVPAIAGALLKDALTPGGGDDDELTKRLITEQLTFLVGLVAFGREFAAAVKALLGEDKGMGYSGPAGVRVFADANKLAQQAHQGEFDDGFRKAFITLMGDLTGLPAVQINRTITGAQALAEGKTDNPAAIAFGFQEKR